MTSQRALKGTGGSIFEILERARRHPEYEAEGLKLKVADALITLMDERGISRSELARKAGTSPAYITKVLRGYENLSLETLAKFAFALESCWEMKAVPLGVKVSLFTVFDYPPEIPETDLEDQAPYRPAKMEKLTGVRYVCKSVA